jgi:hypothetical protein
VRDDQQQHDRRAQQEVVLLAVVQRADRRELRILFVSEGAPVGLGHRLHQRIARHD